jgi:hypothetical protein
MCWTSVSTVQIFRTKHIFKKASQYYNPLTVHYKFMGAQLDPANPNP